MKRILSYLFILIPLFQMYSQTITQTGGWLECAFVKWTPVVGATSYNVYYTGGGVTNRQIDTQLIRSYGTYFRADLIGLTPGSYTVKVAPVINAVEGAGTISSPITVVAHDRNGFAFSGGRIPGGYNLDGTPKTGAVIIYITQNTKNSVSMNITGATINPCVGFQNILYGIKKGRDPRPFIFRMIGNITDCNVLEGGDIVIENANNASSSVTIEGVGSDAVANGFGIRVKSASNIEVRNLGFMNTNAAEGDNVGLQQDNDHIWIHNCDLFYGAPGGAADQVKGDGALDCKKSTFCTFSYNHFWDSGKCNLLGLSENTTSGLYVTYHHNWYDHSDSRHPRVRFYSAHVYNNYYDGNAKYGAGSTMGSSVFMENNYFRNCKYPMLTSMQGSDVYGGSAGTFSNEDGGTIKAFNNSMTGQTRYVPYNATTFPIEFDAIEVTSRNQKISNTIKSKQGANTYNNFDTDPTLYVNSVTVDSPTEARDNVILHSGRVSGGDLIWTFNNAVDDVSYDVNTPLSAALTGYTTSLVFVQGESPTIAGSSQTLITTTDNNQSVDSGTAINDMVFIWGGDASDVTISGLPAAGITFVKNPATKTVTVSGIPTGAVTFTITTIGTIGTPVVATGTIMINGATPGDQIHNFTASILNSTFYTFTSAKMNSTAGSATYDGLTLTAGLKIESATMITYTTTNTSTLTLVFDPTFIGTVKLNGVSYTAVAGIVTIPNVPIGLNTITKGATANLYYIKTVFNSSLGLDTNNINSHLIIYPNPVSAILNLEYHSEIEKIAIYSITGTLVKEIKGNERSIDISNLSNGSYFITIQSNKGVINKHFIKQ
jgi:pectate lyase